MKGFYCSLLSLDLTKVTGDYMRLTDAPHDVVYQGHTYRGFGSMLSIDKVVYENMLSSKELSITLSGISLDFQEAVNNNLFRRAPIRIYKAFVPEGDNKVGEAKTYWRGFTSTPETDLNYKDGYMGLQVSCKSSFDLDRTPSLMRSNNATHQAYHQGDRFFEYATQDLKDDVMWRQ
ncbi:hypothetical protein [Aeromonas veronii]|uniref:hypothetical protein n=1 Tax=Aeromonas veronii TaxID=654 RepID=UPI003D1FE7A7